MRERFCEPRQAVSFGLGTLGLLGSLWLGAVLAEYARQNAPSLSQIADTLMDTTIPAIGREYDFDSAVIAHIEPTPTVAPTQVPEERIFPLKPLPRPSTVYLPITPQKN